MSRPPAIEELLAQGADLDGYDQEGNTVLFSAAQTSAEAVRLLLQLGADPRKFNQDGSHPLHAAAAAGRTSALRILLDTGLPVDLLEVGGLTPLHWACLNGRPRCVKLLLSRKADPNLPLHQETPLMLAAQQGSATVVELLLRAGADARARDEQGRTALDLAKTFLPDLLKKAHSIVHEGGFPGQIRHRRGRNSLGEPLLQVGCSGSRWEWVDLHPRVVTLLEGAL
jgi:hypothetical protein